MLGTLKNTGGLVARNAKDMLPIVLVIAFFQFAVVRQPLPHPLQTLVGAACVLVGLALFVSGLKTALFPLGEGLADALARRGNLTLLLLFAFTVGFASTAAEPALIALTTEAATSAVAAGALPDSDDALRQYAGVLRYATAAAVGLSVLISCLRILVGWHAAWFVVGGYALASLLVLANPSPLTGIAFDAGAAATSAINIPLLVALGMGLAIVLRGRNPLVDGFGTVAFASVMPVLVLLLGTLLLGGRADA